MSTDEEAIAEFIRQKGVTRCPTACASTTRAKVSEADRAELQKYMDAQETARLASHPSRRKARASIEGSGSRASGTEFPPVPSIEDASGELS
jgi:hypothetical protein